MIDIPTIRFPGVRFVEPPPYAALRARHEEPWRHYHVWEHPCTILELANEAHDAGIEIVDPTAAVGFAIWHDCYYNSMAPHGQNELLSMRICRMEMRRIAFADSVEASCAAIMATVTHQLPDLYICPDGALLLDLDLSILGSDPETFARYDRAIRLEYTHVPLATYRAARAAILAKFLARERLFLTEWAADRWESSARSNLARAITALS